MAGNRKKGKNEEMSEGGNDGGRKKDLNKARESKT